MNKIPLTNNPLVIRTDFDDESAWHALCDLVRAPVQDGADEFYAYVDFLSSIEYRGIGKKALLKRLSDPYSHNVLFIVDRITLTQRELPILIVDLSRVPGRDFRAIPTQIPAIQNNLSISNMDFAEFSAAIDDGIFRGFVER